MDDPLTDRRWGERILAVEERTVGVISPRSVEASYGHSGLNFSRQIKWFSRKLRFLCDEG